MTWFINIGDDIRRNQSIRFPFFRIIDEKYKPEDLVFKDTLFECADAYVLPTYLSTLSWFRCQLVYSSD